MLNGFEKELLTGIREEMDSLQDVCSLIAAAVEEEPPVSVREGGIIKDGFDEDIDRLRGAKRDGKKWLAELES